MFKFLKITAHLVLILGLIILSFKPSMNNRAILRLVHPQHVALSRSTSISRRAPQPSQHGEYRCNFEKTETRNRLPMAVVALPLADVFAFNTPRFYPGTSIGFSVAASAPLKTVVLRI